MRRLLLLPLAGLAVLGLAGHAQALSITTAIATVGNTPDFIVNTTTDYEQNRSTATVTDAGGSTPDVLGNSVNAAARYAAITVADAGIFTTSTRNATHQYQITFTITAPAFETYDVAIDTSRLGALTRVDDGTASASANLGAVTGTVNAVANPSLTLAAVALASGNSAANTGVSQASPTITLTGLTGNNVITLTFSWTSAVNSTSGLTGGDEVAVRLGMTGTGSGTTADDYPGVGARNINNDGHFVGINATITAVPEPGTMMLLGAGLIGLTFGGRRRAA